MTLSQRLSLTITLVLFQLGITNSAENEPAKRPKFTVSKETTYVTKPLTDDGFPDYAAAINKRLSQGVTPANNAVVMFYRALGPAPDGSRQSAKFFELLKMPIPPDDGQYMLTFGDFTSKILKLNAQDARLQEVIKQQGKSAEAPWIEKDMPDIADWLKLNEKPLSFVTAGTKRLKYYSPMVVNADSPGLISVLLPGVQLYRSFARALTARAMLHLGKGDIDSAWQDLQTCHRLARLAGQGPTVIEALVGIAIDRIANHADLVFLQTVKPSAKQALEYLKQIEQLPPLPDVGQHIELSERCVFLDSTLLIARGGKDDQELFGADSWFKAWSGFFKADEIEWDVVLRNGNKWFDKMATALQSNDRVEMLKSFAQFEEDLKQLGERSKDKKRLIQVLVKSKSKGEAVAQLLSDVMITLMMPALGQARTAQDRAIQFESNLRVAFALAAFHADHGQYPDKLNQLKPDYLKQIPNDLFSQQQLKYRRTDTSYLLYSVGRNGKDDNGRWHNDKPRGDDIRVRMPLRK